jgi:hypothetical protein
VFCGSLPADRRKGSSRGWLCVPKEGYRLIVVTFTGRMLIVVEEQSCC